MYLSKVILEDFQSHSYSEFSLDRNLNVIIGVSNSGKTSLARALSLVLFNIWDKSWVRHGAKYCRVIIQTDASVEVVREKGEKVNKYILRLPDKSEKIYESFGTDVPEEIQQVLRIHEVQVDTTDSLNLNLASQLDSLFLLTGTGSFRAKVFGKLSGATYLDHAIRELNKDKRQITAEKATKEEELVVLQAQLEKLSKIQDFGPRIAELEQKMTSLAQREDRLQRISELFKRVKVCKAAWLYETKIEALLEQIEVSKIDQLVRKSAKLYTLSLLLRKFTEFQSVYGKQSKLQDLLSKVNATQIPFLSEKVIRLKNLSELAGKVVKNKKELEIKTNELQDVEHKHSVAAQEYNGILKEAGVCPICNRSTNGVEV